MVDRLVYHRNYSLSDKIAGVIFEFHELGQNLGFTPFFGAIFDDIDYNT